MTNPTKLEVLVVGEEFFSESLPFPDEFGEGVEYETELDRELDPDFPTEVLKSPRSGDGFILNVPAAAAESTAKRLKAWAQACGHEITTTELA